LTCLLDTVVPSENPNVAQWMQDEAAEVQFLSTVTICEIARGVEGQRRHNSICPV
jgi:predicted nucleic acid-binding protein